jgi:hypothetical protein
MSFAFGLISSIKRGKVFVVPKSKERSNELMHTNGKASITILAD